MLKKYFTLLSLLFCFFFSFCLHATILETSCFSDILNKVDEQTIVFVDIDDTMINTKSLLGNTMWWKYFTEKISSKALLLDKARPKIHTLIQRIISEVPMNLIEPNTAETIKKLQQQGVLTFALTARCINPEYLLAADRSTFEHLKSVDIDFSSTCVKEINEGAKRYFAYGIIFTDHQEKGPFLKAFLTEMNLHPKKIIFIDDSPKQVKSVEKVAEEMGLTFIGYRYKHLDHFHSCFDPLIANIQLEALVKNHQILSDEEAQKIANQRPGLNPDFFMNELMDQWMNFN